MDRRFLYLPGLVVLAVLMMNISVQAAPLFAGTLTFNFSNGGGGSTTVDWDVYAPNAYAPSNSPDFSYVYTLNGWNQAASGTLGFAVATYGPAAAPISGFGASTSGAPQRTIYGPLQNSWWVDAFIAGSPLGAGTSQTFWWTSASTPRFVGNSLGSAAILRRGADWAYTAGRVMAPGAPEPETWALMIAMFIFTVAWMRRGPDANDGLPDEP